MSFGRHKYLTAHHPRAAQLFNFPFTKLPLPSSKLICVLLLTLQNCFNLLTLGSRDVAHLCVSPVRVSGSPEDGGTPWADVKWSGRANAWGVLATGDTSWLLILLSNNHRVSSAQHKATNSCTGQSQPLRITAERRDRLASEGQREDLGVGRHPRAAFPVAEIWRCSSHGPIFCFSATWAKSEITFCSGKASTNDRLSSNLLSLPEWRGPRVIPLALPSVLP